MAAGPDTGEVQFAVRDSGEGIAAEDVGKIFRSFYQGKGQSGGSGRLGLGPSISKEIVEAHRGRLWVESPRLRMGATFVFTIPYAVAAVPARAPTDIATMSAAVAVSFIIAKGPEPRGPSLLLIPV